jgi:CheY-like chemotaxis protein
VRTASQRLDAGGRLDAWRTVDAGQAACCVGDAASRLPASAMRCKRVLIADDNRDGASALSELIAHWGHLLAVADNGRDAVMTAKAFHPEVAILDIDMPLMDGFEAARALRNREAHAVIIALTGLPPGLLPQHTLASCFDHQFFKPIPTEQLRQLLDGG